MLPMLTFITVFSSIVLGTTFGTILFVTRLFLPLTPYALYFYVFGVAATLCFLFGFFSSFFLPGVVPPYIFQFGAIWTGAKVTMLMLCFAFLFYALATHTVYRSWYHVALFFGLIVLVNAYGLYVSFHPKVVVYDIELKGTHTLHGKKIAFISDTHYGNMYGVKEAKKLVNTLNSLKPEVVLIPGDFFDGPLIDFDAIAGEFAHIQAPLGVLFSNGNHEEYRNTDPMLQALEKANIRILNNTQITLGGVDFYGVTYHQTESAAGLENALKNFTFDPTHPAILLKHKPTLHQTVKKYPFDLMVSGHSHSGQMYPYTLIAKAVYGKYMHGRVQDDTLTSITSSGVGTWGPPQRIGTRSEIVILNVR